MKQKHTKYTQINRTKSMNSEIDPVWQNPVYRANYMHSKYTLQSQWKC